MIKKTLDKMSEALKTKIAILDSDKPVQMFAGEPLTAPQKKLKNWMYKKPRRLTPELFKQIKAELSKKYKSGYDNNQQIANHFDVSKSMVQKISKCKTFSDYKNLQRGYYERHKAGK